MAVSVPPITPYLCVSDAAAAVEFYKKAFGATQDGEAHMMPGTSKIMHVRVVINGGLVMIADDFSEMRGGAPQTPEKLGGSPVTLALQMDDAQTFYDRAVAAGVTVEMPLQDMFWGDRYAQVVDPFGHKWSMSQTIRVMDDAEMKAAADEAMGSQGTLAGE